MVTCFAGLASRRACSLCSHVGSSPDSFGHHQLPPVSAVYFHSQPPSLKPNHYRNTHNLSTSPATTFLFANPPPSPTSKQPSPLPRPLEREKILRFSDLDLGSNLGFQASNRSFTTAVAFDEKLLSDGLGKITFLEIENKKKNEEMGGTRGCGRNNGEMVEPVVEGERGCKRV
ncbi:hypothetical protein CsSME_00023234 [Camellia sinensis var. sinensis]